MDVEIHFHLCLEKYRGASGAYTILSKTAVLIRKIT